MDILSHTFSGVALASCAVSVLPFESKERFKYLLLAGFLAALPDIDAVSKWSKWDAVFGTAQSGSSIYSSHHWYAHHGFFHSLLAGFLFVFLIFIGQKISTKKTFESKHYAMLGFLLLGYLAHLLEDMPTPHSVWGGVRLFFPWEVYVGGLGKIWWWNNYDLFLIIVFVTIFNVLWSHAPLVRQGLRKWVHVLVTCGLVGLMVYQINTREFSYAYTGNTNRYLEYERESLEEQKRILPPLVFKLMTKFDQKLPFSF